MPDSGGVIRQVAARLIDKLLIFQGTISPSYYATGIPSYGRSKFWLLFSFIVGVNCAVILYVAFDRARINSSAVSRQKLHRAMFVKCVRLIRSFKKCEPKYENSDGGYVCARVRGILKVF